MRPYELVTILTADLEDPKTVAEEYVEVLRGLGAEVEKFDLWGKRRLAYPIKKRIEGYYVMYTMKLDPAQVVELERVLGLKAQVLRHLVVNLEEK